MWMQNKTPVYLVALALCALVSGCDTAYYWQAARGQLDLMQRQRPIAELLQDSTTPAATRQALNYLLSARSFALEQLQLEDNQSYLQYVDLQREYVSWNVFATPELSMQNHTWCYPIAGCVSYRGYFDETDAEAYSNALKQEGFDTYVSGVGAYSTLGWFDDPVLSTFLQRGKVSLAALLFHELAHQVLYVQDDTEFNESFASSVETLLLQRWIQQQALQEDWQTYRRMEARQAAFTQLVLQHQQQRTDLFQSDLEASEKRRRKAQLIQDMHQDYADFKQTWQYDGYDNWVAKGLNNAQLSTVAAYHGLKPGFLALYERSGQNLTTFIQECRRLATLERDDRHQHLNELASGNIVYTQN